MPPPQPGLEGGAGPRSGDPDGVPSQLPVTDQDAPLAKVKLVEQLVDKFQAASQ